MCVSPASKLLLWLSLLMDFLFAVNLHPTLSKGDVCVSLPLFSPSCLRVLNLSVISFLCYALSERPLLCGRRIYWTSQQNLSVMDSLCKWGGWLQHQHFITQSKNACVCVSGGLKCRLDLEIAGCRDLWMRNRKSWNEILNEGKSSLLYSRS